MAQIRKIQNDHPDQQVLVEDSQEVSSRSQVNQQDDQFGNMDNNANDQRKVNMKHADSRLGGIAYNEGSNNAAVEGAYDPSQYANLPVSSDLKELFKTIPRYHPITMDIDTQFKAFVPDFIPAIGQVDAFMKMPRPDGQPQTLGLNVLDQPCLNQSDLAKMNLMIKNRGHNYGGQKQTKVHSIEEAQKNPKKIIQWVKNVNDIQRDKQPPSVSYSKSMPDIDSLMQVWPAQVQEVLFDLNLPNQEIDLSLEQYCRVACNILDIPVYKQTNSIVESMHVMFTLYSAFKQNQHFQTNQQHDL